MKRLFMDLGKPNWGKRASAVFMLCATTAIVLPAQTFTPLFSFDGTDGEDPAALFQGSDGNFYGTTFGGGAYGAGTIFEITPTGALTTVHSFCSQSGCPDGDSPSGLVQPVMGTSTGQRFMAGPTALERFSKSLGPAH